MLHVAVVHFHIRLRKKAEDVGQQIALRIGQIALPVLDVVGERHLIGQPVQPLLQLPRLERPRIGERFVCRFGIE